MNIIGKSISLKKIKALNSNPAYVREGEVCVGVARIEPTIGERFDIKGDNGISTSPVVCVLQISDELQIETLNSIYLLTVLPSEQSSREEGE